MAVSAHRLRRGPSAASVLQCAGAANRTCVSRRGCTTSMLPRFKGEAGRVAIGGAAQANERLRSDGTVGGEAARELKLLDPPHQGVVVQSIRPQRLRFASLRQRELVADPCYRRTA